MPKRKQVREINQVPENPVDVQRERMTCKFWIKPLAMAGNKGFSAKELNIIREIITRNSDRIMEGQIAFWVFVFWMWATNSPYLREIYIRRLSRSGVARHFSGWG